jgi:hypothetical protein
MVSESYPGTRHRWLVSVRAFVHAARQLPGITRIALIGSLTTTKPDPDARHCGRRPYLHDDVTTIRLSAALVAGPPLELWPQVVARVPIPGDVEQKLLMRL